MNLGDVALRLKLTIECGEQLDAEGVNELLELLSAVLRLEAASVPEWMPIETAPKDGTPILVFGVPNGEIIGEMPATYGIAKSTHGTYWEGCSTDTYSVFWEPTHWMPLPAPPQRQESK